MTARLKKDRKSNKKEASGIRREWACLMGGAKSESGISTSGAGLGLDFIGRCCPTLGIMG